MAGITILCSGQGGQYPEMLARRRSSPAAAALEAELRAAGVDTAGFDDPARRFENPVAQGSVVLCGLMTFAALAPELPEIELFAGYSVGELTAAALAGALTPAAALQLARQRARLMSRDAEARPQTMAGVIGLDRKKATEIAEEFGGYAAIVNADDHFVLALPADQAEAAMAAARQAGAHHTAILPVAVGSHSPFMRAAARDFAPLLQAEVRAPRHLLLGSLAGARLFTADDTAGTLARQLDHPIDFRAVLESAAGYGCRVFLELGPGDALARLTRALLPEAEARSADEFKTAAAAAAWARAALERS